MAQEMVHSIGDRIQHARHGVGEIVAIDGPYYRIRFERDGRERLIDSSFAGMTREVMRGPLRIGTPHTRRQKGVFLGSSGTAVEEGRLIIATLGPLVGHRWDGMEAILQMQLEGSSDWRQTEWIGFYFEWVGLRLLSLGIGGQAGPRYGRARIDYEREHVWDLKAHPIGRGSSVALNDAEAIRECLRERGHFGAVILEGPAEYDSSGKFKDWHDGLKGAKSAYVVQNELRNVLNRVRKGSFTPSDCFAVLFSGEEDLDGAIERGWATDRHQAGWRNSNGAPRRSKVALDLRRLPRARQIR